MYFRVSLKNGFAQATFSRYDLLCGKPSRYSTRVSSREEDIFTLRAHSLTDSLKQARVEWCHDMINKFKSDLPRRVYYIITGLGFINIIQKRSASRQFGYFKTNQRLPKYRDLKAEGIF